MSCQKNVLFRTVKYNLCINCGICSASCPQDAIVMQKNAYGEPNPVIDMKKCINCGLCSEFCPNTKVKMQSNAKKVCSYSNPELYGLQDASYFLVWSKSEKQRKSSASGGVATEFARYLLSVGIIDGVVHVERVFSKINEHHFRAVVSSTVDDLINNSGSAYQTIDFSPVLNTLKKGKSYLLTATPCVISGIKTLFEKHPKFKDIKIITCALVCSHNVNSQFTDFFAEKHNISQDEIFKVNYRNKDNIVDANNFRSHIYTKEKDILKKNRFSSGWTDLWRKYYFAMNACLYCSDFWGYEADISLKDAWGEWASDALGKSIVIIRNRSLLHHFFESDIEHEPLADYTVAGLQAETTSFKQSEAVNKNFKPLLHYKNLKNCLFIRKTISTLSKYFYYKFGYDFCEKSMRVLEKFFMKKEKQESFVLNILKSFVCSLRKLFVYKSTDQKSCNEKKIFVVGGYGYKNTGDEAQCNETLKLLSERYPLHEIINLTPNVEYSKKEHAGFRHEYAGRVVFFNCGKKNDYYNFDDSFVKKIFFCLKSIIVLLNAYFVRADMPTMFVNADVSKLLYELKTASCFYFCGGGYLTGRTLSRLWDGILMCAIMHVFKVPVVMSGQTIGLWKNSFNKFLAKCGFGTGFRYVKLITVRDNNQSLNALKEIGLTGENYFSTHDDALFCEKSSVKQIHCENYIAINIHYWGIKENEKSLYLDKIHNIVDYILDNTGYSIVFIPMVPSDMSAIKDYLAEYQNERIICFNYDYDFRKVRRVIADSKLCISMKHHPIIFAMGENVPTISLTISDYYSHKNKGALAQYGQEKYSVELESQNYIADFINAFEDINRNYESIQSEIEEHKVALVVNKEKFLKKLDEILLDDFVIRILREENKKIVLWGASLYLENIINSYKLCNKNILGIVDKNEKKRGTCVGEYNIFPPDALSFLKPDEVIISILNIDEDGVKNIKKYINNINPNITVSCISRMNSV